MSNDARPLLVFFRSERSGPARRMESLLAHFARKERARLRVARGTPLEIRYREFMPVGVRPLLVPAT